MLVDMSDSDSFIDVYSECQSQEFAINMYHINIIWGGADETVS